MVSAARLQLIDKLKHGAWLGKRRALHFLGPFHDLTPEQATDGSAAALLVGLGFFLDCPEMNATIKFLESRLHLGGVV